MSDSDPYDVTLDQHGGSERASDRSVRPDRPEKIGRYAVEGVLGQGGFGVVYLAYDDSLGRRVAIKVPHPKMLIEPGDVEEYLNEARTVANLDHPNIVPVHDIGSTDQCPCYVVSKYIEGTDLSTVLKQRRLDYAASAKLVATVGEALHYAHKQGVVHRDVKPSNILLDSTSKPYIVDFGLALHEEDTGQGPKCAGTPAYMSPEQARGEGHRVDGRSDVFSLGVVLYQLLVGRKPFRGDTQAEVFDQVTSYEPRPVRQYDDQIPKELERICHKAMAKRAAERYSTAGDFAEELTLFLDDEPTSPLSATSATGSVSVPDTQVTAGSSTQIDSVVADSRVLDSRSDSQPVRIIPKGLRSFDAHDADFFLELLPGPRDRRGLPDSLRFWKTRIEETDPDETFSVGLIYGPSGCGKSSLVKAGLLPCLSEEVVPIYVEAAADGTEGRLLHAIHKRCSGVDDKLDLTATVAALRRGHGVAIGRKVLIVIDQFEQWLHTYNQDDDAELVHALRQCDGGRVQCIVMVRDDFWLAVSRFLRSLEVRIVEGQNVALADLFDPDHARRVLAAFGRAFGKLPEHSSELSSEQREFLKRAVNDLAEDGKIVCVRLALLAEMMKGKSWTAETLEGLGGTQGVGSTFLEETFSSSMASPQHRYHQDAARKVLKSLLPEAGTDIKGQMKSYDELLSASGYARRPTDFDELIHLLDREIRLITPTDPEGLEPGGESPEQDTGKERHYYQLAHDYLVPSLREWLTRKQRETRAGRAELRLAERASLWKSKPESRHLPSWWEHACIRLFSNKQTWTDSQRSMMDKARVKHGLWSAVTVVALLLLVGTGVAIRNAVLSNQRAMLATKQEEQRQAEATRLVEGLLQADTAQVGTIIGNLAPYRDRAVDDLAAAVRSSDEDSNAKLHAALAILPDDPSVLPFLTERLLELPAIQFASVRQLLSEHHEELAATYNELAIGTDVAAERRFRAAVALAEYDPEGTAWQQDETARFVTHHLVRVLPSELLPWRNALRPVATRLVPPLADVYRHDTGEQVRSFATDTLADYLSADAKPLFDLLADADRRQFPRIFDSLRSHQEQAILMGEAEIGRVVESDADEPTKDAMATRQANAAVMLMLLDAPDRVWPLLRHREDPRVRSDFIHRLPALSDDPQPLLARYAEEGDVSAKRALLLCLGEFDESTFNADDRRALVTSLVDCYRTDPDAGMHGSAEWLLRRWNQTSELSAIDTELGQTDEQRPIHDVTSGWYVNGQQQTFVVLKGGEFVMGSPETERGRNPNETQHLRRIDRRFAIANKEVTRAQWRPFAEETNVFSADQDHLTPFVPTDNSPMVAINWFEAAQYCNWLSEQEGIPPEQWCYEPNDEQRYAAGMKAKDDFLTLSGYRLPTEAEWEFACRAGATTGRYFGQSEELLGHYAQYQPNSDNHAWPVAGRKPNDYGLFDMLGNAYEWCYDRIGSYPTTTAEAAPDAPSTAPVSESVLRMWRGGSYNYRASTCRSAPRANDQPTTRFYGLGFRPARTIPPTP